MSDKNNESKTGNGQATGATAVASDTSLMRVTLASVAGTTLEFYDHFIYGTAAALVFPTVFFSSQIDPKLALLLSLATYGVGFAARPLGALIFGHYGDRIGRKNILVTVLFCMGLATFLIGCLPSYAAAGVFGACSLFVLRLLQGIALGGEWGGAALMVNEFAKNSRHKGLLGSMVQVASPVGFLLASGVFALITALISEQAFLDWGWRIPFLLSAILVIVGLYIRQSIGESPEFLESQQKGLVQQQIPIYVVLKHHWRKLLLAIGTRIGSDIAFYVFALFPLIYLPHLGISRQIALYASIAAATGQAVGTPIFGYLCDRLSTRTILSYGAMANLVWAFVFFILIDSHNPMVIIFSAFVALFLLAAMWAPLAQHLPQMFPVEVRFTGAGVGFQTAGILGGALAPSICVSLLAVYNSSLPVSLYLGGGLLLALVCILSTPGNAIKEFGSRPK